LVRRRMRELQQQQQLQLSRLVLLHQPQPQQQQLQLSRLVVLPQRPLPLLQRPPLSHLEQEPLPQPQHSVTPLQHLPLLQLSHLGQQLQLRLKQQLLHSALGELHLLPQRQLLGPLQRVRQHLALPLHLIMEHSHLVVGQQLLLQQLGQPQLQQPLVEALVALQHLGQLQLQQLLVEVLHLAVATQHLLQRHPLAQLLRLVHLVLLLHLVEQHQRLQLHHLGLVLLEECLVVQQRPLHRHSVEQQHPLHRHLVVVVCPHRLAVGFQ